MNWIAAMIIGISAIIVSGAGAVLYAIKQGRDARK